MDTEAAVRWITSDDEDEENGVLSQCLVLEEDDDNDYGSRITGARSSSLDIVEYNHIINPSTRQMTQSLGHTNNRNEALPPQKKSMGGTSVAPAHSSDSSISNPQDCETTKPREEQSAQIPPSSALDSSTTNDPPTASTTAQHITMQHTDVQYLLSDIRRAISSKLYGRDKERLLLKECWEGCCHEQSQRWLVIAGNPGTGKSRLADSLRSLKGKGSFFAYGNFSQSHSTSTGTLQVLATAIASFLHQIHDSQDEDLIVQCKKAIRLAVFNDRKILIQMIPAFELLLGSPLADHRERQHHHHLPPDSRGGLTTQVYGVESTNRLWSAFSNAIAALCSCTSLILSLDDVQWADDMSLDLLQSLMDSSHIFPLLIVTTLRSSDASYSTGGFPPMPPSTSTRWTPLGRKSKSLNPILERLGDRVTRIDLQNIPLADTERLVAHILGTAPRFQEIAQVVHAESGGNFFHLFQSLRSLVEQGVLQRHNDLWMYDSSILEESKFSSESVLELLSRTLQKLPRPVQEALKVAACLGTEIDVSAIDQILQTPSGRLLDNAAQEGFLTFLPNCGGYQFAHDFIQQAAFSLVDEGDREAFYLNLGRRLWRGSSPSALEENIISIVSLMNMGSSLITEKRERYKIAELNLKAGRKALALPSLVDAEIFFKQGLEFLNDDDQCWEDRYGLALNLFSYSAEVASWLGNFDHANYCIRKVDEFGETLDDRLHAYLSLLKSMENHGDPKESTAICISVLEKLGEKLPAKASKLVVTRELLRVKWALQGKTDQEFLGLWTMSDLRKAQCMEFLAAGFLSCFRSDPAMSCIIACRSLLLSLKYGMHSFTSAAFALYGFMLCSMNIDVKKGYRFGKLGIAMAEAQNSPRAICWTHSLFAVGIAHKQLPIQASLEASSRCVQLCYKIGYVSFAFHGARAQHVHSLVSGRKLSTLKGQVRDTLETCNFYRQNATIPFMKFLLGLISCYEAIPSDSERSYKIISEFEEKVNDALDLRVKQNSMYQHAVLMELAYMHGKFEEARKHALACDAALVGPQPSYYYNLVPFWCALSALAMCRLGIDKGRNLRFAKRHHKRICKYSKYCFANFGHFKLLLDAEILILKPRHNKDKACALFGEAYRCAEEQANPKLMGLISERYGNYLHSNGANRLARDQYLQAAQKYLVWGANLKSDEMQQKAEDCEAAD